MLTLSPVALISLRPGYVLYVPLLGLALYFGELLSLWTPKAAPMRAVAVLGIAGALAFWHTREWPGYPNPADSNIRGLAEQFRSSYPDLKPGSRLLFANDTFGKDDWVMTFTLRLLYRDTGLEVRRVNANADQQPRPEIGRAHV